MWLIGLPHEIDHIIPLSKQGTSTEDNLCLACSACNNHKYTKTHFTDPETDALILLYNPRLQAWADHFEWSDTGTQIIGKTPCGRATIEALQMNNDLVVAARAIWVSMCYHLPV